MILSQIAGSTSSGLVDDPQEEDAQPPEFALASNWSENLAPVRLSTEITGADIERLRCGLTSQFKAQAQCQLKKLAL
ncbi:conserved hypothetical protein [Mesorhizobium delmotii]|uniref:Uncharacterized protein n=1 Tax=Mesorhizobium delmotii TaxID=1631247 RepID=A0A2P9ATA2_9HYPH|nr:conserved hypothetical protein [Mesorhizobium delmotii]